MNFFRRRPAPLRPHVSYDLTSECEVLTSDLVPFRVRFLVRFTITDHRLIVAASVFRDSRYLTHFMIRESSIAHLRASIVEESSEELLAGLERPLSAALRGIRTLLSPEGVRVTELGITEVIRPPVLVRAA